MWTREQVAAKIDHAVLNPFVTDRDIVEACAVGELDMMMNLGRFLGGDHDYVRKDIQGVVDEAEKKNALVKVILEICYLSPEQIALACEIARDAGDDFVKTSTGFGEGPATPQAVAIMVKTVGDTMGVKAAGGIRDWETAVRYLDMGCTRLGVRATESVLEGQGS